MKKLIAKDVMTRAVLVAKADWPLDRLAEFLIENGISGAPVTDEERTLFGVVSLTDLVRHDSLPVREPTSHALHDYYRYTLAQQYAQEELASFRVEGDATVTVQDIMTPTIYNVDEGTSVQRVAEIMTQGQIHRLFVTRDGKVEGIITTLDMLKVIRDL